MRIGNGNTMPIHLNAPNSAQDKGVLTEKTEEAADKQDEPLHISMAGLKKLQEESEDPKNKLPQHIQQMIEAIERLIEMIETAEEALAKAKETDYPDADTKRDVLAMHQNQVNSLEFARNDAVKGLMEAMKEAGISEPGIIANLLR